MLPRFRDPLGGGFLGNYIKSPARRYEKTKGRVTFEDVAAFARLRQRDRFGERAGTHWAVLRGWAGCYTRHVYGQCRGRTNSGRGAVPQSRSPCISSSRTATGACASAVVSASRSSASGSAWGSTA